MLDYHESFYKNNIHKKRLELEYYYVNNMSLWLDIKCIFKTVEAVVKKTGAE